MYTNSSATKMIVRISSGLILIALVVLNRVSVNQRFPGVPFSSQLIDVLVVLIPPLLFLVLVRNKGLFWIGAVALLLLCIHQGYWALQWYIDSLSYPNVYGPGSGLGPAIAFGVILPLLFFFAAIDVLISARAIAWKMTKNQPTLIDNEQAEQVASRNPDKPVSLARR